MYRCLFILVYIFHIQTACAQSFLSEQWEYHPKERIRALHIDSIKTYTQDPDEQPKLSEISLYNRQGDVIKTNRRDHLYMTYQYDTLGKLISSCYFPTEGSYKVVYTYVYDDKNNLIHFISEDTREGIESSRNNYIYQNGMLQKTEYISGEYLSERKCSYDDQNRLIREDWIINSKIDRSFYYTYDKKNNIITYTTIHETKGFLSKIIMKYNAENLKTEEFYYDKNNQLTYAYKMHYRKDGLMSYKECFRDIQNEKIKNSVSTKIIYVYTFY